MKKVLIITPLHPANKFNGACQRINKVINQIKLLGNDVVVLYTCQDIDVKDQSKKEDIERNLSNEFGKAHVIPSKVKIDNQGEINQLDDFYPSDVAREYLKLVDKIQPDVILVNYVFLSKLLEVVSGKQVEKIIDTHDKLSRAHIYETLGLEVGFFCTTEEEELKGLHRADKVICIQDNETKHFKEQGVHSVHTIGHLAKKRYFTPKGFKVPKKLGFLGSNHIFNSKSIESFLQHPSFKHIQSEFDFVFAGGICENPVVKNSKVTVLGRVDREEDFYDQVDIVINPITIGTGLKIKTIDSLSFGLPVIGTKIAFDGINSPSEFHNADDIDAIFTLLERVVDDPAVTVKLANLSKNIFEDYQRSVINSYKDLFWDKQPEKSSKIIINHVVNFTEPRLESDLYIAQPITMFSLDKAKKYAEAVSQYLSVKHHIVKVEGENIELNYLEEADTYEVSKTIRDEKGFESFKPLPMLADVLSVIENVGDDEYVVFTNADISLAPFFYTYIEQKIWEGYDALIINRRTVSKIYSSVYEYDEIVSDYGISHSGFDCFVFKASAFKNMFFAKTLIGVHLIGRVLLWNVFNYATVPLILKDKHLTFHIGDDNAGKDENNQSLLVHNYDQAVEVLSNIYNHDLEKKINLQAPDALKIYYKPNIVRSLPNKKKVIFLHSMFRTGSSYLWSKFSENFNVRCYYEPFHETLSGLTLESIEKYEEETGQYHARLGYKNYWSNYKSVLNPIKGVNLYDKYFAYSNYTDNTELTGQFKYIEKLIEKASSVDLRPVFQFNRSALRQRWFKYRFPQSVNFYIFREPLSQFNSFYESYEKSGKKGFLRTQLAYVDHNLDSECYRGLKHFIDMPNLNLDRNVAIPVYFSKYDEVIKRFNERELFFIFYWDWIVSLLQALRNDIDLINMSNLSQSLVYRRKVESRLIKEYIYTDLDDCSVPNNISDSLSDREYLAIMRTIVSQFSKDLLPYNSKLSDHGLKSLVENIVNNDKVIDSEDFHELLEITSHESIEFNESCLSSGDGLDIQPVGVGEYDIVLNRTSSQLGNNLYGTFDSESNSIFININIGEKNVKVINGKPFPLLALNKEGEFKCVHKSLRIKLNKKTRLNRLFIK